MKITRKLIEKYHDGLCTPEEKQAVENWLLDDDTDIHELADPALGSEMWQEIEASLGPAHLIPETPAQKQNNWLHLKAAAVLLVFISMAIYLSKAYNPIQHLTVVENNSQSQNKKIDNDAYLLSIGPRSNVEIDNKTGTVDFCGAFMINPKRDIEFTMQGSCPASKADSTEKIILKKGLKYIAVNYGNQDRKNEIIVLEASDMTSLPPWVLKQLIRQFNI